MNDLQVRDLLLKLYRIVEAGEKGFATAAANMPNPGIKTLLKSYAQQRVIFKNEILEQLRRYGQDGDLRSSIPGAIHRGRVAIFAAMSLEKEAQERVILKEAAFGEKVALRTYGRALEKELPPPLRQMLTRQMEAIRGVSEEVSLMRGRAGKRLVPGVFPSENEAGQAVESLRETGVAAAAIQKVALKNEDLYQGRGATVLETVLSGAFGGAMWASLTGILVGYGAARTTTAVDTWSPDFFLTWLLAAIGFTGVGILIGSALAFFIGSGIKENDDVDYLEITQRASTLVKAEVDEASAGETRRILGGGPPTGEHPIFKPSA